MSSRTDASINTVSDLFHPNSKAWNSNLIESLFCPWETTVINRIHVSEVSNVDTLMWPLTPDEEYSIKTAYRLLESSVP